MNITKNVIKFVLLGDAGVGKTALMKRAAGQPYPAAYQPTFGADFTTIELTDTRLMIWDIAGDSRLCARYETYLQGSIGAIAMVVDYNAVEAIDSLKKWDQIVSDNPNKPHKKLLFINKIGNEPLLATNNRPLEQAALECNILRENIHYVDAKLDNNIDQLFVKIAQQLAAHNQHASLDANKIGKLNSSNTFSTIPTCDVSPKWSQRALTMTVALSSIGMFAYGGYLLANELGPMSLSWHGITAMLLPIMTTAPGLVGLAFCFCALIGLYSCASMWMNPPQAQTDNFIVAARNTGATQ